MASGRGIAMIAIMLAASSLLFYCDAVTCQVGGSSGWTFNVSDWPNGKIFKGGDILEFIYDRAQHNVAVVSETKYKKCIIPSNATTYQTGDDKITLTPGKRFFIDAIPGNCELGVKIAVYAWPV